MNQETQFCKKIVYKSSVEGKPTILLGKIVDESPLFVTFKTARREILIAQSAILSIEETCEPFFEVKDG